MIKAANIKLLELSTRWVSVIASTILLGLQVTNLIRTPKRDSAVDDAEE